MIKLLIVDDSATSVRHLAALTEWKELGITEVFTAHHAIKARNILEEHSIDILICDVDMPKEDGISLAKWAVKANSSLSLIFLDETLRESVLYEALHLHAKDVLVKPVDTGKLQNTVKQILLEKQIQKNTEETCRVGAYWIARQQFLEDIFWRDAVFRPASPSMENVQYYANLQQIKFDIHSLYSLILISTEKADQSQFKTKKEIGWSDLYDLARELLLEPDTERRIASFPDYFIVISEQLNQDELTEHCRQFIQQVRQRFQIPVCCYVWIGCFYQEFYKLWQTLCQIKEDDIEQRESLVFVSNADTLPDMAPLPPHPLPAVLGHLLYSGEEEKFFREYHAFLENSKKQAPLSLYFLKNLQKDLIQCFMIILERKELYAHQVSDTLFKFPARKLSELETQIRCFFEELRQVESAYQRKDTISSLITRYIDEHLSEPISRDGLSKLVGLSPDYMSRIFKQEMGISLKEYMIKARLQKAAHLLLSSKKSIAEISGEVGYPNFAYFSKLYKETFGKTPSEVRREGLRRENKNSFTP